MATLVVYAWNTRCAHGVLPKRPQASAIKRPFYGAQFRTNERHPRPFSVINEQPVVVWYQLLFA